VASLAFPLCSTLDKIIPSSFLSMKNLIRLPGFAVALAVFLFCTCTAAQLTESRKPADEATEHQEASGPSDNEIVSALKQALELATGKAVALAGKPDGFLDNEAIRILLPPKLQSVGKAMRLIGEGETVDVLEIGMNRAAERATPQAKTDFPRRPQEDELYRCSPYPNRQRHRRQGIFQNKPAPPISPPGSPPPSTVPCNASESSRSITTSAKPPPGQYDRRRVRSRQARRRQTPGRPLLHSGTRRNEDPRQPRRPNHCAPEGGFRQKMRVARALPSTSSRQALSAAVVKVDTSSRYRHSDIATAS
jgi:hypothetical protein